jgi:LacI family transcriptional regulator
MQDRDRDASRGQPPVGVGRRASLADVAARADVSVSTVSRVVNGIEGRAAPETVERIRRVMRELGYRPDSAGRTLRRRQSRSVGVIVSNLSNPIMAAVVASIEPALRDIGHGLVLADSHDRPDLQDDCLLGMRAQMVRTIVLVGAVASPVLDAFAEAGESLLFVMRTDPSGHARPYVGIDNLAAGRAAAGHLVAAGARSFGALHSPLTSSAIAARLAGFRAALTEAGVAADAIRLAEGDGAEHLTIGYRAMDRMLADGPPPEGLLCASDLIAYGAHRRLAEAGLRVPDDVRLVGVDGNPLNPWVAPWLASVNAPYDVFGAAVVDALEALWRGERPPTRLLPIRLVAP